MVFVSVTRLRLRRLRLLPAMLLHARRSRHQVRLAPGFRGGGVMIDRVLTFWTLTAWDDEASMRGYMTSGPHRAAMPRLLDWCDEASVAHWSQAEPEPPTWEEADRQMRAQGRASRVRHPSPAHAGLAYRAPGFRLSGTIEPITARTG